MKEKETELLLDILSAEGLLNEEQIQLIRSREALQRSKILKSKTPGIRHTIVDRSIVLGSSVSGVSVLTRCTFE